MASNKIGEYMAQDNPMSEALKRIRKDVETAAGSSGVKFADILQAADTKESIYKVWENDRHAVSVVSAAKLLQFLNTGIYNVPAPAQSATIMEEDKYKAFIESSRALLDRHDHEGVSSRDTVLQMLDLVAAQRQGLQSGKSAAEKRMLPAAIEFKIPDADLKAFVESLGKQSVSSTLHKARFGDLQELGGVIKQLPAEAQPDDLQGLMGKLLRQKITAYFKKDVLAPGAEAWINGINWEEPVLRSSNQDFPKLAATVLPEYQAALLLRILREEVGIDSPKAFEDRLRTRGYENPPHVLGIEQGQGFIPINDFVGVLEAAAESLPHKPDISQGIKLFKLAAEYSNDVRLEHEQTKAMPKAEKSVDELVRSNLITPEEGQQRVSDLHIRHQQQLEKIAQDLKNMGLSADGYSGAYRRGNGAREIK